jgi:predicted nucleic acid-binding protein
LFSPRRKLISPDLIGVEVANAIWKRVERRDIDSNEAVRILNDFQRIAAGPLETVISEPYLSAALRMAIVTRRTVYDCLYLALAMSRHATLITADVKFANALANSPFSRYFRLLTKR